MLPNFWGLVVLAVGCGLVAYGAVDHVPGTAYLGVANLVAFVAAVGLTADETLQWWPYLLIVLGLGALAVGLARAARYRPSPTPTAPASSRSPPAPTRRSPSASATTPPT